MATLLIEEKKLYYETHGHGISLLMIHGSLCRHRLWDHQHSLVKQAQLILLDLPGHGESEPLNGKITVARFASIVAQFIEQLQIKSVVPVGHSLGGAIAIQLALDYPHLLQGLVLIGTGAKLGVLPAILESLKTNYESAIEFAIGQLGFATKTNPKLIEFSKAECLLCNPAVGYADFIACNNFDVLNRIEKISLPTLVLVGEEDQLTPIKWSQFLVNKILNAELKIIKEAGHMVMLEKPDEINQAIFSFLREL